MVFMEVPCFLYSDHENDNPLVIKKSMWTWTYGCESKPRFVAPTLPLNPCCIPLCRSLLLLYIPVLRMLGAGMPYKRTLSQTCVSQARRFGYKPMSRNGRPSRSVTNAVFLIHSPWQNTIRLDQGNHCSPRLRTNNCRDHNNNHNKKRECRRWRD